MIKIENYAKAYTEILKIIEYLPDSEYQKIPQKLIDQFQEKSDKESRKIYMITMLIGVIIKRNRVYYVCIV